MKYVQKAIEIEAIQWNGANYVEISNFCDKCYIAHRELTIQTLEGTLKAEIGDFIIKGIKGEFYPCKEEIFNLTYDLVEENKNPLFQKSLHNTTANEATKNGQDGSWGDGDTFKLISKASSESEGWMKSTKAMPAGSSVVVQVTTQQRNSDGTYAVAEALTTVPNAIIAEHIDNGVVISRAIIERNVAGLSISDSSGTAVVELAEKWR